MTLPGIGRYTASAIASIAFGFPSAVLDGNVMRVLARLDDLAEDIAVKATQAQLWERAQALLPEDAAGDYNQAIMELGQKVCRPIAPRCTDCPLQAHCLAFARNTQAIRPVKTKKPATPHYHVAAAMVWDDAGRVLIAQRPLDGLLGGLWEFPGGSKKLAKSLSECLQRELLEELAIEVDVLELFSEWLNALPPTSRSRYMPSPAAFAPAYTLPKNSACRITHGFRWRNWRVIVLARRIAW
ncbi:MAG UNVERIFIED_CONTAM: NUDIX domain-containing protein [Anaerolineae bacterium]|jgi:A/G-specific adenine glycosylase